MTKPLISIDNDGQASAPTAVRNWVQQVGQILRTRGLSKPRVWPYRYEGSENLCCDYDNFAITFIITGGETTLAPLAEFESGNTTDMVVHDMTEALLLISRIEKVRAGRSVVELG